MMSTRSRISKTQLLNCEALNRAMGLVVGLGALMLASAQAPAQTCDTDLDAVVYSPCSGDKPNVATPPWEMDCPGDQDGVDQADIVGGILVVDDTSTVFKTKYCREGIFDEACLGGQDAVYEFVCKAISVTENADNWTPLLVYSCGMGDGFNDFRVAVTTVGVGFWEIDVNGQSDWLKIDTVQQYLAVNWSMGPHLFRVEKDDLEVRLFMNNSPRPGLTIPLATLPNNSTTNLVMLATTSLNGRSKFNLNSFRYRVGTTSFDDPDPPTCVGDIDGDKNIGASDLLTLLAAWGTCPQPPATCLADLDSDGCVGASDLLILLGNWGPC